MLLKSSKKHFCFSSTCIALMVHTSICIFCGFTSRSDKVCSVGGQLKKDGLTGLCLISTIFFRGGPDSSVFVLFTFPRSKNLHFICFEISISKFVSIHLRGLVIFFKQKQILFAKCAPPCSEHARYQRSEDACTEIK